MFRISFVPVLALVCAVPWAVRRFNQRVPGRRIMLESAFAGYLGVLIWVVFLLGIAPLGGGSARADAPVNLVPTHTLREIIQEKPNQVVGQIAGNVVMFVPLGFFLPWLAPRFSRFAATALAGLAASIGIESVQFLMAVAGVSRRTVDIDDVILNTLGACAGYVVWWLTARARHGGRAT